MENECIGLDVRPPAARQTTANEATTITITKDCERRITFWYKKTE